jgi:hypothetical protein
MCEHLPGSLGTLSLCRQVATFVATAGPKFQVTLPMAVTELTRAMLVEYVGRPE